MKGGNKMKLKILPALLLGLLNCNAYADLYVVGLGESKTDSLTFKNIAKIVTTLEPGDRFRLYDLKNQKIVTAIDVPIGKEAYKNPRVLVSRFAPQFKQIKGYIEAQPPEKKDNFFLFPQFLNELSTHVIKPDEKSHILVVGNGMYHDTREPHFSMVNERFPSDGNLRANIEKSVYSTKNKMNYLKDAKVHFVYTNEWDTDIHRDRVNRFWSLFIKSQGGQLVTFTSDGQTGLDRFTEENPKVLVDYNLDESDREAVMIELRRETVEVSDTTPQMGIAWLKDNTPIYQGKPDEFVGSLKVGIRWKCKNCDYDLWVKSDSENKWLYFGNKSTSDGYFNKDYLDSPDKANALEYSVIEKDIDIRKLGIRVNLYSGTLSDADSNQGEVRAYYNGKVYSTPFKVKATKGNRGANHSSAENNDHWFIVEPNKLFNIPDASES